MLPSNLYVQPGSSVIRNHLGVDHAPAGGFNSPTAPASAGRFRSSFQTSGSAQQRPAAAQNAHDSASDQKPPKNKSKQPHVDGRESSQDKDDDDDSQRKKHSPDTEPLLRSDLPADDGYHLDDASALLYPQLRHHPYDAKSQGHDPQKPLHYQRRPANRPADPSPPKKPLQKPSWGAQDESCYNNDAAIIPVSPRDVDDASVDDYSVKNLNPVNRDPGRSRNRDRNKRFSESADFGDLSPRNKPHASPNRRPSARGSSYRPQNSRQKDAHARLKPQHPDARDSSWNDQASAAVYLGHNVKSPTAAADSPGINKHYRGNGAADDHSYARTIQSSSFSKDSDASSQRLQQQHPQPTTPAPQRFRPRQKPHSYYSDRDPDDSPSSRPPAQKRVAPPLPKSHDPPSSPVPPSLSVSKPLTPYRMEENGDFPANIDSPTWSQPSRLKKLSAKDWPRSPENDPVYQDHDFAQRDRGISFIRNGVDAKRQKRKLNNSDYHPGSGTKRSRGHDRGNRSSTNWKSRRQH